MKEKVTYKKSLVAKLVLGQDAIQAYQSIKDLCKTHKKVSTRMSFGKETISFGRVKVGAIKIVVRNISLYLALDPKDYEGTKYRFKDMSETKIGETYPMRVVIKGSRSLKYALELLEDALAKVGATQLCPAEDVNYQDLFYPRGFDVLLEEGYIKKYVKYYDDETSTEDENVVEEKTVKVTFCAKTIYEAAGKAKQLFIITNVDQWNVKKGIPMHANKDGSFSATKEFPMGTHLEFKICKGSSWKDVEKGIWKEEIRNHHYDLVKDIEVEDLIHNFYEQ